MQNRSSLPADSLRTRLSRARGPGGWRSGRGGAHSWSRPVESTGGFRQVRLSCPFSAVMTSSGTVVCFSKVPVGF